ncbi:MAG: SsrA-binding protein [Candidatus Pacebacteria bacterium CG_4_10_14_0_8_um_filter_43_12]|nr:MAG: SsrA-binding protein [Candidatus Pacebacteria bacterium CG10_big_fil_rev_8_21_14_0_10_44_11]PIY79295.1 MAG: SsrA-binding protein [Candidatus Pacebacteria bacterium CG_4_10_14_0_8_um_filter_43_12]
MQLISNKKARFDYQIEQTYTAGLILTGQEVKSLRLRHGSLTGSYVKIVGGQALLLNAQVNPYSFANTIDYEPRRTRQLLLKKKELLELSDWSTNKKRALIPLSIDIVGRYIKLQIGVGRGLKEYDKRQKIKARDQERDLRRQLKEKYPIR